MKNIRSKYNAWELENQKEFYILAEQLEEALTIASVLAKKYLNVFLFFVNLASKKIIKYRYLLFKLLFASNALKKQIGPEYLAEDVYNNNNNNWFRH